MNAASEGLKQRIESDMKEAMRAKDKDRLGTIRLVLAAIKQREVDERITLADTDILAVLDKMVKQRRDSIAQVQQAGRQELADKEAAEIKVIQEYLPAALSEDEVDTLIAEAIATSGAASPQDIGKIMALLKPQLQGRADMGLVSRKVKEKLSA
ncbi:MAG: GatB/YqeY domain-containing protein [Gammaproteobacteria bacterium]